MRRLATPRSVRRSAAAPLARPLSRLRLRPVWTQRKWLRPEGTLRKRAHPASGFPRGFEAHQPVRSDLEALYRADRRERRRREVCKRVRRVVVDGLLNLLQDLLASRLVAGVAFARDSLVNLLAAVFAVVERAL